MSFQSKWHADILDYDRKLLAVQSSSPTQWQLVQEPQTDFAYYDEGAVGGGAGQVDQQPTRDPVIEDDGEEDEATVYVAHPTDRELSAASLVDRADSMRIEDFIANEAFTREHNMLLETYLDSHRSNPSSGGGSEGGDSSNTALRSGGSAGKLAVPPEDAFDFMGDYYTADFAASALSAAARLPIVDNDDDDDDEDDAEEGVKEMSETARRGNMVPRIELCRIAATPRVEIGRGGDRGSRVYRVSVDRALLAACAGPDTLAPCKMAEKIYPRAMLSNEVEFIECAARWRWRHGRRRASGGGVGCDGCELCYGASHLVLPEAVVVEEEVCRGVLMPLYSCSLRDYLGRIHAAAPDAGCDRDTQPTKAPRRGHSSTFLLTRRFEPVRSADAIVAIAFQLLQAIVLMNHHLPHAVQRQPPVGTVRLSERQTVSCPGYVHNDIHLSNILLLPQGKVALCDFELVSHNSMTLRVPQNNSMRDRLPPYARQSPHGLFCPTADTWALGLIVINLLTGVDPLFSNEDVMNDFSDGPLLIAYNSPQRRNGVAVLDWTANLRGFVDELLLRAGRDDRESRTVCDLLDICSRCLVNRAEASPATALQLAQHPVFARFHDRPHDAEDVVLKELLQRNAIEV